MIKANRAQLRNSKSNRHGGRKRSFNLESLEQRMLLAVSPQLIGIQPNVGELINDGDTRTVAPRELVFRFESGQSLDPNSIEGIQLTRAGADGVFGSTDDVTVAATREVGPGGNSVIMRFADSLPDDTYRIDILGSGSGVVLRSNDGCPFDANLTLEGIQNLSRTFTLDLGTEISAVVPQPVSHDASGALVQSTDQIEVYFNDTDLDADLAGSPSYYQLILTADTVTNTDDTVFLPTSVNYDAVAGKATLTFSDALESLAGGAGTYRLRVGNSEAVPPAPMDPNVPMSDPGDSFATALDLGELTSESQIVSSRIDAQTFEPDFPGSEAEPGHRQSPRFPHLSLPPDSTDGITTIQYNFQQFYGFDPVGNQLVNLISEAQKQRAREVFEIFGSMIGIDVVETDFDGFTVATGDMRAVNPFANTGPGGTLFEEAVDGMDPTIGLLVLDNAEDWNSEFAALERASQPSYYETLFAGIAQMLGANPTSDLPPITATGDSSRLAFENEIEVILPGSADLIHTQHTYRPDSIDVDLYGFEITGDSPGLFSAEIFAERRANFSHLDSVLRLYRDTGTEFELVAQNDDYYSEDSFLEVELDPGQYFVGVSSTGNSEYDPSTSGTGFGGTSQGLYDLRLDFRPEITDTLMDESGVAFDGDGDGVPGGVFNFWFKASSATGANSTNEVQELSLGGATAGTFTLTLDGETTNPIDFDASPSAVRAALEALPGVSSGDVAVTGTALPAGPIRVEFTGNLAETNIAPLVIDDTGLTDATPVVDQTVDGMRGTRVIFVDKSDPNPDNLGDVGTIANPYNTINDALNQTAEGLPKTGSAFDPNAARAGDIVRIVGNDEGLAYEIGRTQTTQPLSDGSTLDIPQDITVMVDAGATFQLRRSAIIVGSSGVTVDHSGAAFQVLGTPDNLVSFTSINDDPAVPQAPFRGDWGGILFAGELDGAQGRPNAEDQGIFLNYVSNADIRYGGGIVNIGSIPQEVAPIDIREVRPTISNNVITQSAVAAISATPDSFEETNFHAPAYQSTAFTSDYNRVGPDIHDNQIQDNTINGLFIRVQTPAGNELRRMTVNGRWDDADIIHFLSEVLEVQGTPGGPTGGGGFANARLDARLAIDPNLIVKLDGARIETGIGSQLIAEGLDGQEIVFTSLFDDRFGASGSFDTSSNGSSRTAAPGDWGGIYAGPVSRMSLDHAVVTMGGGISAVAGTFAGFNAVEIHQAEARIANSSFFNNASGLGGQGAVSREGSGTNASGVIFVRGAQPIIINNEIAMSGATSPDQLMVAASANDVVPAITIDANSMNLTHRPDYGRSVGRVDQLGNTEGNQGPLVRGNRLEDNDVNGMVVRAATMTIEGVWDDTDMTHVVWGNIHVPDFHTYGGLRLESSPTESLVVKFGGNSRLAGFDTTGTPLDITDRIGGSLHVIGQPERPVILTSIADESVGAGATLDGSFSTQTLRPGFGLPPQETPSLDIVLNFDGGFAMAQQAQAALEEAAAFWEERLSDDITVTFDVFINDLGDSVLGNASGTSFLVDYDTVVEAMQDDAAANERDLLEQLPTFSELNLNSADDIELTPLDQLVVTSANLKALGFDVGDGSDGVINIDTQFATGGDFTSLQFVMIHEIGHALGFASSADNVPDGGGEIALTTLDLFRLAPGDGANDFTNNPRQFDPGSEQVFYDGGIFDPTGIDIAGLTTGDIPLSRGTETTDMFQASHWREDSSPEMRGIYIGIMDPAAGRNEFTTNDERAFGLIGYDFSNFTLPASVAPGNWRGLQLDRYTNDRNVDVITERESANSDAKGVNSNPQRAEFIGSLAPGERQGDENLRLGFEVVGVLNDVDDVDVYSFTATAGTGAWIDIDHTSSNLDSVVELINQQGTVLARSDNSLDGDQTGSGAQDLGTDFFSTNPLDAGMRVTLPGAAGTTGTYFVRVRSSSPDLDTIDGGLTQGAYELNLRLREIDEIPGTTVKYADIRYAQNGIEVSGLISSSPLLGESREVVDSTFEEPIVIGNIQESSNGEISISSSLEDRIVDGELIRDVDWFLINVPNGTPATTIDIDYADGTGNPNTYLSVFRVGRNQADGIPDEEVDVYDLVYVGDASAVSDDFNSSQTGGTFGSEDPYVGPVFLNPGFQLNEEGETIFYNGDYLIAVTSEAMRPDEVHEQFLQANPTNPEFRLGPIDAVATVAPGAVNIIQNAVSPFTLNDMTLFVTGNSGTTLTGVNPFTGGDRETPRPLVGEDRGYTVGSLAMRADGSLFSLSLGATDDTSGNFLGVDWAIRLEGDTLDSLPSGINVDNLGDDGITTHHLVDDDMDPMTPDTLEDTNTGIQFNGLTFTGNAAFGVGDRVDEPLLQMSNTAPDYTTNVVYRLDGYPEEIDNNDTGPGTATNIEQSDIVHVAPEDPPVPFEINGALTDIIEVGQFNTNMGELVQGLAALNGLLYGVTDQGRLYELTPDMLDTRGNTRSVATIDAGMNFTGLTLGPPNLDQGQFAQTFFATAVDPGSGMGGPDDAFVYAFDATGAPVAAFDGGQSRIQINVIEPRGLAFSTLDRNLWQKNGAETEITFSAVRPEFVPGVLPPGGSFFAGNQSGVDGFNPDYNFPGGARGHFEADIDLSAYGSTDEPVLYFDYILQSTHPESNVACDDMVIPGLNGCDGLGLQPLPMTDALRVYADSGNGWQLLATNNSATDDFGADFPIRADSDRILGPMEMTRDNEFDILPTDGRPDNNRFGYGIVQELFDNSGQANAIDDDPIPQERQARVSLEEFAGSMVTLRWEFSTQGTFDEGRTGDEFGDPLWVTRRFSNGSTDNQLPGFIDFPDGSPSVLGATIRDIVVGFAERGEEVTNVVTSPHRPPTFSEYIGEKDLQITEGDYQLFIRPAWADAFNMPAPIDTNDSLSGDVGGVGNGDQNVARVQGQLILHSNQITNSEDYGILVEPDPQGGTFAADLLVPNVDRLVRGVVIENNLIANSGIGGILYTGDARGTAAVPFGRIINNTIVGNPNLPEGVGIEIGPQASPTLLNNITAFTSTALIVDSSSASTVVVGQLLHNNFVEGPLGDFEILSDAVGGGIDGLFVDPRNGNFQLADGAVAIDSSIDSQEDRPSITNVLDSFGYGVSPIIAPERDILGQLRIDDPTVESPPGQGANVIKDRGAFERADDAGPRAEIVVPSDNSDVDLDPDEFEVSTQGEVFQFFEVRLFDLDPTTNDITGVGIDDSTVIASAITLRRDTAELVQGIDYEVSYNATNNILRIIPLAGIWVEGVYEVELDSSITDLAGNPLVGNDSNGNGYFIVGVNRDAIVIDPRGWHNSDNPSDVNDDGFVAPIDANIIITELNLRRFSTEEGMLDDLVQSPPFYDVNNDGFVAPIDVIQVINTIERQDVMAPLSAGAGFQLPGDAPTDVATPSPNNAANVEATPTATRDVALRSYVAPTFDIGGVADVEESQDERVDDAFANWV